MRLDGNHPVDDTHGATPANGDSAGWRAMGHVQQDGDTILYAINLSDIENTTHRLALLELGIGALALVLLAIGGSLVVRRSLRPLVAV